MMFSTLLLLLAFPVFGSPRCGKEFLDGFVCGNMQFLGHIKPDVYACAETAAGTPGCWNGGAIVSFAKYASGNTGCWCTTDNCSFRATSVQKDLVTYKFSDCAGSTPTERPTQTTAEPTTTTAEPTPAPTTEAPTSRMAYDYAVCVADCDNHGDDGSAHSGCLWACEFMKNQGQTAAQCEKSCDSRKYSGLSSRAEQNSCRETCQQIASSPWERNCFMLQPEIEFLMWKQYSCGDMQEYWGVCTNPEDRNHGFINYNCPATCARAKGECDDICFDNDGVQCNGCLGRQGRCNSKSYAQCTSNSGARWCGTTTTDSPDTTTTDGQPTASWRLLRRKL